ncbi:MAG: DegT/DnrJ/EryC1/StrS family aminotransferase [Dehalococcoidia bacterium]|jgi:L-seryl-tRNA(Ser) seleniumtransferase
MNIYESLGVKTLINCQGEVTRLGGALMEQETIDAMAEAARYSVRMDELQAAASRIIARVTGAEAGYVTSGASAALTLATAACLAGLDVGRMNRLPDTSNMPNEVLMDQRQRQGYDHAIRLAGAKIINVGMPNFRILGDEAYTTKWWEFESAITERTAAIAYFQVPDHNPPMEEIVRLSRKYKLPLIVDAAEQVPPMENLRRFIEMGATLVAYSGGKGIRGPQNSGILCGKKELIASVALQNLDMGLTNFEAWEISPDLITKEKLRGIPQQGLGRGMKASKESIVGLLVALQRMESRSSTSMEQLSRNIQPIGEMVKGIPGVETEIRALFPGSHPMLMVKLDEGKVGKSAVDIVRKLKEGEPSIYVTDMLAPFGMIFISAVNMIYKEQVKIVGQRLLTALKN